MVSSSLSVLRLERSLQSRSQVFDEQLPDLAQVIDICIVAVFRTHFHKYVIKVAYTTDQPESTQNTFSALNGVEMITNVSITRNLIDTFVIE